MTARIVIFSTLHHARHTPRHHRESNIIPGVPICGTILRRPHRAIAVDDRLLCAACWPAVSDAENAWDSGRIDHTTQDVKRPQQSVFAHRPGPDHDDLTEPGAS